MDEQDLKQTEEEQGLTHTQEEQETAHTQEEQEPVHTQEEQAEDKKKKALKIGVGAGCAAAALLAVFFGFSFFFGSHFFFRSTINGVSVAGLSAAAALERLQTQAEDYSLTIVEEDEKTESLSADDLGMKIHMTKEEVDALLEEQKPLLWVYESIRGRTYVSEKLISCDEKTLEKTVEELSCVKKKNTTQTKDAAVEYKNGAFEIVDEVYGNEIKAEELREKIEEAAVTLQDKLDLKKDKCYVQPEYTSGSKELKALRKKLNGYLKSEIVYQIGDAQETISEDQIGGWLYAGEKMQPAFHDEQMEDFIASMAKKYDTYGQAKQLQTQYGVSVSVPGGNYGWRIDREGELAQLKEDIASGKKVRRDFVYQYSAASRSGNDYGNSYVEINRTAQHLFLVIDGAVVLETNVVTGSPYNGHITPTGAYRITYCEKNATLRGPGYVTPVAYWMPFNGDIGLHDATWQSAFGGTRYKDGYGSHGCVNLPLSAAGTIFGYVSAGFPVLLYDLPGTETLDDLTQRAVTDCKNAINAIGPVDAGKGAAIGTARGMYEALSDSAKPYVDNLQVLIDAENAYAALQVQAQQAVEAAAQAEAAHVIDLISQIGEVTLTEGCKAKIEVAENAYGALSDAAKLKVSNYGILIKARSQYNYLAGQ